MLILLPSSALAFRWPRSPFQHYPASVWAHRANLVFAPSILRPHLLLPVTYVLHSRHQYLLQDGSYRIENESRLTKLCRPLPIYCDAGPIVRPCLVPMCTETDHRLDSKTHPRRRCTNSLVLGVMRHIWSAVEELIDPVPTVGLYHAASSTFRIFLDDRAWISKQHTWFDECNGLVEALSSSLRHSNRIRVGPCSITHIIGFIEISMETPMIE